MKSTFRLKELLASYTCIYCGKGIWKSAKYSRLFPKEFFRECDNSSCKSHSIVEVDLNATTFREPLSESLEIDSSQEIKVRSEASGN